jgi:hypothetical protein
VSHDRLGVSVAASRHRRKKGKGPANMKSPEEARRKVGAKAKAPDSCYAWIYGKPNHDHRRLLKYLNAVLCVEQEAEHVVLDKNCKRELPECSLWRIPMNGRSLDHVKAICARDGVYGVCYGEGGHAGMPTGQTKKAGSHSEGRHH